MDFKTDMKQVILMIKRITKRECMIGWLLVASLFAGCNKADQFYKQLITLPQLDNRLEHAYKTAYIVGDTIVIAGRLQPQNNLSVTIGGINGIIVKTDSISEPDYPRLDRIFIPVTQSMVGKSREVKITSGGYTINGPAIDVYTPGGPGSFGKGLESVLVKSLPNGRNTFIYNVNGKGDVYYYTADKLLTHIQKDGSEELVYDFSKGFGAGNTLTVNTFLAGGVDPQGQYLYFSAITSKGFCFCRLEIATKQILLLNQSTGLASPYEGAIDRINTIVTGIYPDANGNVYLAIGQGNGALTKNDGTSFVPDAIASYSSATGQLVFIYKKLFTGNTFSGMPGSNIDFNGDNILSFRLSPDENLMYLTGSSFTGDNTAVIGLYDLSARLKTFYFSTNNSTGRPWLSNVIAPFSGLTILMGVGDRAGQSFGYMPMPGKRLQILLYQDIGGTVYYKEFPKWVVFDFSEQRTYAYAPGKFQQNNYIFQPSTKATKPVVDELLNYDEVGNLYASANGKAVLIKTQTVN